MYTDTVMYFRTPEPVTCRASRLDASVPPEHSVALGLVSYSVHINVTNAKNVGMYGFVITADGGSDTDVLGICLNYC